MALPLAQFGLTVATHKSIRLRFSGIWENNRVHHFPRKNSIYIHRPWMPFVHVKNTLNVLTIPPDFLVSSKAAICGTSVLTFTIHLDTQSMESRNHFLPLLRSQIIKRKLSCEVWMFKAPWNSHQNMSVVGPHIPTICLFMLHWDIFWEVIGTLFGTRV